jgi:hypothetical protein
MDPLEIMPPPLDAIPLDAFFRAATNCASSAVISTCENPKYCGTLIDTVAPIYKARAVNQAQKSADRISGPTSASL